ASGIKRGIWVTRFWYVRTVHPKLSIITGMTRDGTFLIENGRVTRPVKDLRFTQSMLEGLNGTLAAGKSTKLQIGEFIGASRVPAEEYGEAPIDNLNVVEAPRDRTELTLARWAFADDLPVLGICRGQQLLNVALGGSLYQDLRHQRVTTVEHSDADGRARNALLHRVRLDPDSRLAQLIDETSIDVN